MNLGWKLSGNHENSASARDFEKNISANFRISKSDFKKMSEYRQSLRSRLESLEIPDHPVYDPLPVRVYHCDQCTEWFNLEIELTNHKREHQLTCPKCGLKFKTVKETEDHDEFCQRRFGVIRVRQTRPRPSSPPPSPRKYRCLKCRKKFDNEYVRNSHQHDCKGPKTRWTPKK